MIASLTLPIEILSQLPQIYSAIREISNSPAIALDTESNSFHRYPEQLCLIQIADSHKIYIVDTISLNELGSLKSVFEDNSITKVLHSADNDIRSIDRHHGVRIRNVYDVKIAAVFSGVHPFSLVSLVKDLLGIKIPKSKRLQKADWAHRPLAPEAIDYAANDVRYLFTLKKILDDRLRVLGRRAWVAEECVRLEDIRYVAPDVKLGYLSVKGTQKLDGQNLAILQSLHSFRERERTILWHQFDPMILRRIFYVCLRKFAPSKNGILH
jgi:ribonuclease D